MSDDNKPTKRAVLIVDGAEGAEAGAASPQDAPAIDAPEVTAPEDAPRRRRGLGFWLRFTFWVGGLLASAMIAFSLERMVVEATEIAPWAGWAMRGLVLALVVALAVLALRELAAIGRIRRMSRVRRLAELTHKTRDVRDAKALLAALRGLYLDRPDLGAEPGVALRLAAEQIDAIDKIQLAERRICQPLDDAARAAVRRAAREVATTTALAPSILLDAISALYLNLRMIRRISEIYGGRAGFLGSLRLARRVVEHAMAAGLIALGDDVLEPLMGGGVASRVSRRLGEGVVNGAMTARIGLAAMDVCRPMPFDALPRPKLREIALSALRRSGDPS